MEKKKGKVGGGDDNVGGMWKGKEGKEKSRRPRKSKGEEKKERRTGRGKEEQNGKEKEGEELRK